jgi:hypothetical protein
LVLEFFTADMTSFQSRELNGFLGLSSCARHDEDDKFEEETVVTGEMGEVL